MPIHAIQIIKQLLRKLLLRVRQVPLLLIMLAAPVFSAHAQSLDIYTCLDSAAGTMPLLRQKPLLQQELQNTLRNFTSLYLPAFIANGQATYQSDVPELPFKIPGFAGLDIPKDQYRVWLEVDQPIYDAGYSKAEKAVSTSATAVKLQELELSLNQYQQQVISTYFQVLLAICQKEIISQTIRSLTEKERSVRAAFSNGALQQNDVLSIQAAIISQERDQAALDNLAGTGMELLSLLTGIDTKGRQLTVPQVSPDIVYDINNNPEISLIQAQQNSVNASAQLLQSERMPRISLFGQAGIGSPNPFNFFKNQSGPFYIAGLRANWAIWDWNRAAREKNNILLHTRMLDEQRAQKGIELKSRFTELARQNNYLNSMLLKDDTLAVLKDQIRKNASHQLDQGVITANDYLNEVSAAQQAVIRQQIDQISLYKNILLLQLEMGTLSK